ncbi:DUF4229 domain-containing protein [Streptomyces sp. TP-A0874]|uniref:DUF4229 domain-containing protein n=1 Tax=Streptomyces sp. TP-A0874 TaxID=549819 RepID=UPI001FCD9E79|nr:DUF4229 domain-containing protein [Streptomyces sp. TP-A0874]
MTSKKYATIRYTALRLGVFVGCLAVLVLILSLRVLPSGFEDPDPLLVVMAALLLSGPLSWVLLRRERGEMSVQIVERVERAKSRLSAAQGEEDAAVDAAKAADTAK